MGLEHRNGRVYFYRSRRVGKLVRREYVAGGHLAALIARHEAVRAERQKLDK